MNLIKVHERKDQSFILPTTEELANIEPGSFVRVGMGGERFWVEVTKITGDRFTGLVDSYDVPGFKYNSRIEFHRGNILVIFY